MKKQRPVLIYVPPKDEAIDRFVRDASLRLAAMSGDASYLDPEVTWGLSEFIKLVGEIKARQLNGAVGNGIFDSAEKQRYPVGK